MKLIDRIRTERLFSGDLSVLDHPHVAYLGLHNASRYLDSISQWLSSMEETGIPLLVADNNSEDGTWESAQKVIRESYSNSVFVRHAVNMGGYGGFSANMDLIRKSDWVTTLHQDDRYQPNHLSVHRELAFHAKPSLGIISSEQLSHTPSGEQLGYPRPYWLMDSNPDAVSLFLANLKHHTLPFSGASFRLQLLRDINIPWHSTAFPDTEIVLKMIPDWTAMVTDDAKVHYLENPDSESHQLSELEKHFGSRLALIRVFASEGFQKLCKLVKPEDFSKFINEIDKSLKFRLKENQSAEELTLIALEYMIQSVGYESVIAKEIEFRYPSSLKSSREQLHRLHTFGRGTSIEPTCFSASKGSTSDSGGGIRGAKSRAKSLLTKSLGKLPPALIKWAVRAVIATLRGLNLKTSWNFYWRK